MILYKITIKIHLKHHIILQFNNLSKIAIKMEQKQNNY